MIVKQKTYNRKHSQTRVDIKRCFGLLKSKFRKLKYLDVRKVCDIPCTIVTCCVLHNFVLLNESVTAEDIPSDVREPSDNASVLAGEETAASKRDGIMRLLA